MTSKRKLILLIVLSLLSVFFAEVISGSMPFPLLDIWGYFVVIPLYGLHTILLLSIVSHYSDNRVMLFRTLYFGGMLFGLYEAYITKVLWVGLAEDSFMLLELSILDFIVLVFFWHPLFSFIIPSLVFERLLTNSDTIYQGLPSRWKQLIERKYGVLALFVIVGLFSAFNGISPDHLFLSLIALGLPILIVIYLLRRKGIHKEHSLLEIMPKRKGLILSSIYLALIYIGMTFYVSFDVLTVSNQAVIWGIYLLFGVLFYRSLRQNKHSSETEIRTSDRNNKSILGYFLVIVVSGVVFVLVFWLLGIRDVFVVTTWIVWIIIGIALLITSLIGLKKGIQ